MAIVVGGVLLILSTLRVMVGIPAPVTPVTAGAAAGRSIARMRRSRRVVETFRRARRRTARPDRRAARRRQPVGVGGGDRRRRSDRRRRTVATSGKDRVRTGAVVAIDTGGDPGGRAAGAPTRRQVRGRPRRRRRHRGRQAGRAGRPPGRRQPGGHAGPRAARPLPRHRRRRRTASARASCTASTPAARGCWSSPAPREAADALVAQFAAHTRRTTLRRRWCGASRARRTASSTPRSAAIPATRCGWRSSPTASRPRTEYEVVRRLAAPADGGAAVVPAGDRPDPPDPGPPRRRSATRSSATRPTATVERRSG